MIYNEISKRRKDNMLRTKAVKLTVIPAVAYRSKSPKGINVTLVRADKKQPGIAAISKTSGDAVPTQNTDLKAYPMEAFKEAISLTAGLPYRNQNAPKVSKEDFKVKKEKAAEEIAVNEKDYEKILRKYTDKNGKFSYELLNKDLISFAKRSSVVKDMVAEGASAAKIRNYIVTNKFRNITGNDDLNDKQIKLIISRLDETQPKGVFKELDAEIRKMLKANKRK